MKTTFKKWLKDSGMSMSLPYTEKDLEKAYMAHAQSKKEIIIECLNSLKQELKGYPIGGTVQGVITEKDLQEIIDRVTNNKDL